MLTLTLHQNYFKKFIFLFLLSFFYFNIVLAENELPECIGEDDTKWTNCLGTYLNKDITKPGSPNVFTRDYKGEFGSVPGKREGKGSSILYIDGKLYSKFVGEFINNEAEGLGVNTYEDGGEYVGDWKDGKRHGQGTFTTPAGSKYVGEFKDGKLNGQGVFTYMNGNEYVGDWKDGKRHGQGTFTTADGEKNVGEFKDGKLNGQGTTTWPDGDKYVGEYKDGKRHGQGTYTFADGEKYVGDWKDDKKHGQGTKTWSDGVKYTGDWKDDKQHGQGTKTWSDGVKYTGEWKDGKQHGQGFTTLLNGKKEFVEWKNGEKISLKSTADIDIDFEKEKKKLEEELKKLKEETKKAQKEFDKQKNIKERQDKIINEAYDKQEARGIKFAQQFIIDLQDFIKDNPEEFDILEITELMIDNKIVLDGEWNSGRKKSFNSLMEYTMKSENFKNYYDKKFTDRIEILLNEFNSEVENLENNIDVLKKYLRENLTSNAAEKIVLQIRNAEKALNNPNLENLIETNKQIKQFINSLSNVKSKKTARKKITKYESISEKKSSIKGSPKEKIIKILSKFNINYSDIKFSRNQDDFIIHDFGIAGQTIKKVEVEGLNEIYLEGFFEFISKGSTDYFNKYNGKYFDKIKLSGINNFKFNDVFMSGKEIGISNLDFKKFDIFKKLINSKSITEEKKNAISYIMSMSFDDFYIKDLVAKDDKEVTKFGYYQISKFKELAIGKMLLKNYFSDIASSIDDKNDLISVDEFILERFILDNTAILAFLNSETFESSKFSVTDYFSYIQNGIKSLQNFEMNNVSFARNEKKVFDINNIQFNNIKFDYFGNYLDKKIPISFELDVDAADFRLSELDPEFKEIADTLKYDAIKFDFGAEWIWNTRRNNLSINLDLGITDAASIQLISSFADLSTDILDLTGAPLGTYLMTNPKIKSLNLSLNDNSLKNRLINLAAMKEDMNSHQYKDFLTQSLKILIATFSTKNRLVEDMEEAVTNFINNSDKITLSVKPSEPLSITDLIPDFKEANADKIITKLNLKIIN